MLRKLAFLLAFGTQCLITPLAAQAEDISADVVVIGAGASGLAATVAAAEGGAKVVLLEKMGAVGGTGNFGEGVFAAESHLQRAKNINYTRDDAFKFLMEYTHWRANARLVRAIIDKSPDTIAWMEKQGVEFTEPAANYPGGLMTWHLMKGRGKAAIQAFYAKAQQHGAQVMLKTPATDLIVKDGAVKGVVAKKEDGSELRINAKSVIIASGGFINSKEMLAKYTDTPDIVPVGSINKTGDGIKMAWAAGADNFGTSVLQHYRPGIPGEGPESQLNAPARQPYLWVNQLGERFCDESVIFSWPYAGNALARQPGRVMYVIIDETTKNYMIEKGIDVGVGVMVPVATKLTKLDAEIKRGVEKGHVFVGDSIEELAKTIKVEPAKLKATIDEYNQMSDQRQDTLFVKSNKYLQPVRKGKFYAFRAVPFALGTLGGIKINEKTEVIDTRQQPIPGLFAVGNDAGGMYGDSYDVVLAGGTWGFAVNSGRIAAENSLKLLK